jgi:hypothetical protein
MIPTTLFADGVIDIHVANGVARITLGASTGQQEQKPVPSGVLIVPVVQLPIFARVFGEVTRQIEQRTKDAMAQSQAKAEASAEATPAADGSAGAFRFNG